MNVLLNLCEYLVPLLELETDHVFQVLLLPLLDIMVPVQLMHGTEVARFVLKLLVHFHQNLGPHFDFIHCI